MKRQSAGYTSDATLSTFFGIYNVTVLLTVHFTVYL